jgi:hypothetical protein
MANIRTTELSVNIATIVAAQALGYLRANTVLARLVNRDYDDEVASFGQTVTVPIGGTLSVNDKAGNAVVTLQTPTATSATVTLNKHKEVSFLIEDIARALARADWLNVYASDAMAHLAEQIDDDLAGLYSGFSQTADATTGLTEEHFREAQRLLNAAKAPQAQRYAVLHEDAQFEALGIERIINRDYAEALGRAAASSFLGQFMGFDLFMDQMVNVAAGQAKNLFFQRNAMVFVTRPLPPAPDGAGVVQTTMSEDGIGLRVTISYSADYLGVQVTIDVLYGVAELRDSHAVVVSTQEI